MSAPSIVFQRDTFTLIASRNVSPSTRLRLRALLRVTPPGTHRSLNIGHAGWCDAKAGGDCDCEPDMTLMGREN